MKRILAILLTLTITMTMTLSLAGPKKSNNLDSYTLQLGIDALKNEQIEEALPLFERVIENDSTNGYAHFWLALGLSTLEEVDATFTAVNNALKYLPKKEKTYQSTAYQMRARVNLVRKDTAAALKDYAVAIKCQPEKKSLYEDRAELYFEMHEYKLSNKDYDRLLELDPHNVIGFMGKGRNYRNLGQNDHAITHFTYVIQMYPNFSRGYSFRAECLLLKNKYSEAADDILAALDLDEDSKARGLLIDEFRGDKMNVIKPKLQRMTHKEPNRALWRYYLAVLLEVNELYKDAIRQYHEANRLDAALTADERIAVDRKSVV